MSSRQLLPSALSVIGAVLAAIGLYALVAFSVAERMRESGIRVALGAVLAGIVGLILTLAASGIISLS